jgi:hypothetical protein
VVSDVMSSSVVSSVPTPLLPLHTHLAFVAANWQLESAVSPTAAKAKRIGWPDAALPFRVGVGLVKFGNRALGLAKTKSVSTEVLCTFPHNRYAPIVLRSFFFFKQKANRQERPTKELVT